MEGTPTNHFPVGLQPKRTNNKTTNVFMKTYQV